jgi:CRP-like cAMP-binding protein
MPKKAPVKRPPQFCVLDLSQVTSMDASAARTCFLQFSSLCSKRGIVVCAACATPRQDWVLRSHGVSYPVEEQEVMQAKILEDCERGNVKHQSEKMLLFLTAHEALEFCETALIRQYSRSDVTSTEVAINPKELTLAAAFARILDSPEHEVAQLHRLDDQRYHDEMFFSAGQHIFLKGSHPTSFYVVLAGAVASGVGEPSTMQRQRQFFSGAGLVRPSGGSRSNLLDPLFLDSSSGQKVHALWPVCGVFGYIDLLLDRPRTFGATATQNGTKLAVISRSDLNLLADDPELSALVHRVLLRASVLDLQNCTCMDV